jgi:hypothetical protein
MNQYLRAIAIDFDGTLADGGTPAEAALVAIEEIRDQGLRAVLVTGRILDELRGVFPSVDRYFDAIVAENGAVISLGDGTSMMSTPVEFELDDALFRRAVPFRRGQVLLATHTGYENEIQEEIHRLGLECQLVYNRDELMILPPGVSKGSGLLRALGSLGISYHNTIAIGDAENDHSLLGACEIGVAVANSVDGLKRHADLVLDKPDGEGVAALLASISHGDGTNLRTDRWQIEIGTYADGRPATIAASQVNLLITGRSKSGKSFVAGAIAERLMELGYSVCLIDPEGDYTSLGKLHGVECLGSAGQPPDVEQIRRFLVHRFGSVIVDLSLISTDDQSACTQALLRELAKDRKSTGLPHWIIVDEAHHALGLPGELTAILQEGQKGYCLVTYQPQVLERQLCGAMDYVLALPGGRRLAGPDPISELERISGISVEASLTDAGTGYAFLVGLGNQRDARLLELAPRRTAHVRHWHKYVQGKLQPWLRFVFRRPDGSSEGTAANIQEFCDLLYEVSAEVVAFHAARFDLSRWIRQALQEEQLAGTVRAIEQQFSASRNASDDIAALRKSIVKEIMKHYG